MKHRVRRHLALILFAVLICVAPKLQAQTKPHVITQSDLQFLSDIESQVLPETLIDSHASHGTLLEYFIASNEDLHRRMLDARDVFAGANSQTFRAMTIVAGPAGVGKTFIKGQVYEDIPKDQRWKCDVREIFSEFVETGLAELRADLRCDAVVFNRLPALTEEGRVEFSKSIRQNMKPFVVVDSIDEIHPNDYEFVLQELEHAALDESSDFTHLVVFGRPLAFRTYWLESLNSGLRHELKKFVLAKPRFISTGDLQVSNWNYDCWKHSLCRESNDTQSSLSLEDYKQWAASGYRLEGPFKDLFHKPNHHIGIAQRDLLLQWSTQHRTVASVLPNLAANEMVRDISVEFHLRGQPYSEQAFMDSFFHRWLERDTRSDDRPSQRKPEHLVEYLQLLELIATNALVEGRLDRRGYFSVPSNQMVSTDRCQTPIPVIQILNRSGLVSVDPTEPLAQRFRFEPFWFHRYLVEQKLKRDSDERSRGGGSNAGALTATLSPRP